MKISDAQYERIAGYFPVQRGNVKTDNRVFIYAILYIAEINAIEHRPMYMDDYVKQLDTVLSSGNRKLLSGAGSVSHKQAIDKATAEYRKYQETTLSPVEQAYLETLKEASKEIKGKK